MKKILSISLTLLFIFNSGGYFFIYYQIENYFKTVAINKINDYFDVEKLEQIELNNSYLKSNTIEAIKIITGKEFYYNNRMYDIFMVKNIGGKIILLCLNDENEDLLHNALENYINEKNSSDDVKSISNIIKILINLAVEPNNSTFDTFRKSNDLSIIYNFVLSKIVLEIPSPPPRYMS